MKLVSRAQLDEYCFCFVLFWDCDSCVGQFFLDKCFELVHLSRSAMHCDCHAWFEIKSEF